MPSLLIFTSKNVPLMEGIRNSLLEAKEVFDFRHPESKLTYFGGKYDYLSPEDGFFFIYDNGKLALSSTPNMGYSAEVLGKSKETPMSLWNMLGGKVSLKDSLITIDKEDYDDGKERQRNIVDVKQFQKALKELFKYGVKPTFKLKGVSSEMGKTVAQALILSDPTDLVLNNRPITMYHGTSEKLWGLIQKQGMKSGKTEDSYGDLIPNYSDKNIYLATTSKDAEFYAKRQGKKDKSDGVVLKVTGIDTSELLSDDMWMPHYSVSPEDMNKAAVDPHNLRLSGRSLGEFAYRGFIPPQHIHLLKKISVNW